MKPVRTWIVVADGAQARFLMNQGPGKGLECALEEEANSARQPSRELGSDKPGRVHDRFGPGRHTMVPRVDWHQFEKQKFAREMASILDSAAERRSFDRLVLVAPPKTLGALRSALNKNTARMVVGEVPKDLTQVTVGELPDHLGNVIVV
ncbi:MAG: host attachment protein [Kiloniellales bacterium]